MDVKTLALGFLAGYILALFVPLRLDLSFTGGAQGDRPPGMTGGGPGWLNNPGL